MAGAQAALKGHTPCKQRKLPGRAWLAVKLMAPAPAGGEKGEVRQPPARCCCSHPAHTVTTGRLSRASQRAPAQRSLPACTRSGVGSRFGAPVQALHRRCLHLCRAPRCCCQGARFALLAALESSEDHGAARFSWLGAGAVRRRLQGPELDVIRMEIGQLSTPLKPVSATGRRRHRL